MSQHTGPSLTFSDLITPEEQDELEDANVLYGIQVGWYNRYLMGYMTRFIAWLNA